MRILVEGFSSPKHCAIIRNLARRSFTIVYWVAKKRVKFFIDQNQRYFKNTIFHDYIDALAAIPVPAMDTTNFTPLGVDILGKLGHFEAQILSLMTRIDFGDITFLEKHHRYYQYVWYWYGVLTTLKPDIVVFHDVPHIVFNTTLYYLAKLLGIKTVLMRPLTAMRDRMAFFENWYDYQEVRKEYKRLEAEISNIEQVAPDVRQTHNQLRQLKSDNIPYSYAAYSGFSGKEKAVEVLPKFSRVIKNIRQFRFWRTSRNYIRLLFRRRELCSITKQSPLGIVLLWRNIFYKKMRKQFKKEYESLQIEHPDMSVPYIYFPLNRQPEATTNPMGGVFDDQILAVDLLAAVLPPGWKLYVKEHPDQWTLPLVHTGRYRGYYQTIKRHKNTELVSVGVCGLDLMQNAKAVATIAGSTAMEAAARGKPTLIFGYPMYAECDGMLRIDTLNSGQEAMKKIEDGYVPDELKVLRFFQALKNVSVGAFIQARHARDSKYTYEESIKNMTEGLYTACSN